MFFTSRVAHIWGEIPATGDTIVASTYPTRLLCLTQVHVESFETNRAVSIPHANMIRDIQYHSKLFTLSAITLEERVFELLFIDTHLIPELSKNHKKMCIVDTVSHRDFCFL